MPRPLNKPYTLVGYDASLPYRLLKTCARVNRPRSEKTCPH